MSEAEIDKQLEQFRKSEGADDHSITQTISGHTANFDNRNQLTTPVILGFLVMMGLFAIGLAIVGIYSGYSAASAAQSERNAKLAQYQLEESLKKAGIEVVNPPLGTR